MCKLFFLLIYAGTELVAEHLVGYLSVLLFSFLSHLMEHIRFSLGFDHMGAVPPNIQ